jgi:hypothetical protein
MSTMRWVAVCLVSSLLFTGPVDAQVPPHYPGTVCFTPQFWCWAAQPGPPGGYCSCPSAYGWIGGRLG